MLLHTGVSGEGGRGEGGGLLSAEYAGRELEDALVSFVSPNSRSVLKGVYAGAGVEIIVISRVW